MSTGRRASVSTWQRYPSASIGSASLFMSWISTSVAPSGRHIVSRLSTTGSSARICSAHVGNCVDPDDSLVMWSRPSECSAVELDVEVLDVEVVVGADLVGAQAELLRGVAVRAA